MVVKALARFILVAVAAGMPLGVTAADLTPKVKKRVAAKKRIQRAHPKWKVGIGGSALTILTKHKTAATKACRWVKSNRSEWSVFDSTMVLWRGSEEDHLTCSVRK